MKTQRNSIARGNSLPKKLPLTNRERAEYFAQTKSEEIINKIQNGEVAVSPKKLVINSPARNPDGGSSPAVQTLQQTLRSLRANLKQHRLQQKQIQKAKLLKAHELITKMKKEKEQHQRKMLQQQEQRSILHTRIYSETTLNKMRQRLEERVALKKKQIEERIQAIADRHQHRDQISIGKEIQYWQKMKKVKGSQSSHLLPSLVNPEKLFKNDSDSRSRKHSLNNDSKPKDSHEQQSKQITLLLENTKLPQQKLSSNCVQQKNEQRLNKIKAGHKKLARQLSDNSLTNEFLSVNFNKSKLHGDYNLKESLLKAKKREQTQVNPSPQINQNLQDSIQLQAREVSFHKNQHTEKLKQNWNRVLSRIEHKEISQEQGLQLLNSMERRLDKIDIEGMAERLKKKYQLFKGQAENQKEEETTAALITNDQ